MYYRKLLSSLLKILTIHHRLSGSYHYFCQTIESPSDSCRDFFFSLVSRLKSCYMLIISPAYDTATDHNSFHLYFRLNIFLCHPFFFFLLLPVSAPISAFDTSFNRSFLIISYSMGIFQIALQRVLFLLNSWSCNSLINWLWREVVCTKKDDTRLQCCYYTKSKRLNCGPS